MPALRSEAVPALPFTFTTVAASILIVTTCPLPSLMDTLSLPTWVMVPVTPLGLGWVGGVVPECGVYARISVAGLPMERCWPITMAFMPALRSAAVAALPSTFTTVASFILMVTTLPLPSLMDTLSLPTWVMMPVTPAGWAAVAVTGRHQDAGRQ